MIHGRSVLAVIPARGGSKGLPRKNVLPFGGRPLLAWSFLAAKESRYVDRVILSSEDPEIIALARGLGLDVPFIRPAELADDQASGTDVFAHALAQAPGYDLGVLLQPTSPLRTSGDIDAALDLFLEKKADRVVSVTRPEKSPFWMRVVDDRGFMRPLIDTAFVHTNRQDHPDVVVPNGAVYVTGIPDFLARPTFVTDAAAGYLMPRDRSIDIDTPLDWLIAETLLLRRLNTGTHPDTRIVT